MDNQIIDTNKNYVLNIIEENIDLFCNAIKKKNTQIEELIEENKNLEKNRGSLARAYAKKLGGLMTIKQYNRKYGVVS